MNKELVGKLSFFGSRQADSQLQSEKQRLELAIAQVVQAWAGIEYALTRSLSHCIGEDKNHYMASAILYGVTGLDARLQIARRTIHAALRDFGDHPDRAVIGAFTDRTFDKIGRKKSLRNAVLHGCITTFKIDNATQLRVALNAADHYGLTNKVKQGQLPGYSANDIETAVNALRGLFVDVQKPSLFVYHRRKGNQEKYSELLATLTVAESQPRSEPQTPQDTTPQPTEPQE